MRHLGVDPLRQLGDPGEGRVEPRIGGLGHHQIVAVHPGPVSRPPVRAEDHHGHANPIRVAAFPAGPGIGIGAVHVGDDDFGLFDAPQVARERRGIAASFLFVDLRQPDFVTERRKRRRDLGVEVDLGQGEERPGEIDAHQRTAPLSRSAAISPSE
ncbi:MAG TPA: hypothetical protein VFW46_02240 [Stellaceae bacterium]|nr:hypothetical protein [Stellaceae bacterium]